MYKYINGIENLTLVTFKNFPHYPTDELDLVLISLNWRDSSMLKEY